MEKEYIIYKISCLDEDITFIYIGSTINYTRRKSGHKSKCNNENNKEYNYKLYQTIRNNGGWINWIMAPIEKLICSKIEGKIREDYHMTEHKANLNMIILY